MSTWRELRRAALSAAAAVWSMGVASLAWAQPSTPYPGIGRPATVQEVQAWDIDVRPDFKGLPAGSGSVARGMLVWEAQCASCHGIFGENNEVFTPLVGGTTAADVQSGRVARLDDPSFPGRTTLMKAATLSTLWDYIRRAMPWNAPKTLATDDVYAVTAYLLHLGDVLPAEFVLSQHNMHAVQARLPNRHGMSTAHGLWPGKTLGNSQRPDARTPACMTNCRVDRTVVSSMPEFARDAHGNLAAQNRRFGAQVGADTARRRADADDAARVAHAPNAESSPAGTAPMQLLTANNCLACHGLDRALVGPALKDVAGKYASRSDAASHLAGRIRFGSSGVWGAIAMPAQPLSDADAQVIAQWLAAGAGR